MTDGSEFCNFCKQDLLLHCNCEDFDSQDEIREMEREMDRECAYSLEPPESPDVDYGDSHDWENCDYDD